MVPYAPLPPPPPLLPPSPEGPAPTALVAGVMDLSSPRRRWHHPRFLNLKSMNAKATKSASPATPPTTPPTTVPVGGVPSLLEEPEDADVDEEEGVASTVVPVDPSPPHTSSVEDGDGDDDDDDDSESEPEDVEDAPDEEVVGLFELEVKLESGLEVVPLIESAENEDDRVVTSDESDWDAVELPVEEEAEVTVEFERVDELDSKDDDEEDEVNEALSSS